MPLIRPIKQHMVCLDKAPADSDFDAHAQNVAIVNRARVGVAHFVGSDAGAGAVNVLCVALLLSFEET